MRTTHYCVSDANIHFFSYFFFRIHSKTKINWSTWICPTTAWANCSPIFSPTWIDFYGSISPTTMWVKFMAEFLPETASWEFCTWTTTNSPGIFFSNNLYKCLDHFIFRFLYFGQSDQKRKKSAVLFVYFLRKKSAFCLKMTADFFVFWSLWPD